MAGRARSRCLSLLTLLAFFHASFGESTTNTDSLSCYPISDEDFRYAFNVSTRNEKLPVKISVYYKKEESKTWIPHSLHTGISTYIKEDVTARLEPRTLYQVRVVSEWSEPESDTKLCEFCSPADKLDPVQNLSMHSNGPNWFSLSWSADPHVCPKDVKYVIRYHDNIIIPTLFHRWKEVPGYPLTLSSGRKYVIIMKGVHPNNTYFASVSPKWEHFPKTIYGPEVTAVARTLPDLEPPIIKEPPYVSNVTNTTVKALIRTDCTECISVWQYKEPEESVWHFAGRQPAHVSIEITGLNVSTVYQVRALLQRDNDCAPHESDDVPFVTAATLPMREPIVPAYPLRVIKASNTSLTVRTYLTEQHKEYKGFTAVWKYKRHTNVMWTESGNKPAQEDMTINGLIPNTLYDVKFHLVWPASPYKFANASPTEETRTCPSVVPRVRYTWVGKRSPEFLRFQWSQEKEECTRLYLVRWKQDDTGERDDYPPDSFDVNSCPNNATLLDDPERDCNNDDDYGYYYCYAVRGLNPGNLYVFEVTAMDGEGRCSEPETYHTSTPYRFWGGISVGHWSIIIIVIILLFASVPACILLKKRLAIRMAAARSVAFSTASCNGTEGGNGDMDGTLIQEPTTRILESRRES